MTTQEPATATTPARPWLHTSLAVLGGVALGIGGTLLVLPYLPGTPGDAAPGLSSLPPVVPPAPVDTLVLTPEAITLAGITTAPVTARDIQRRTQVPGSVMADATREVKVMSVVSGIVTQVHASLGATVRRGAPLATVFSPELAEAQTKYLTMQAQRTAAQQKLQRTEQLATIGAVSRQELEDVTALHASHAAEVAAAHQRLVLLGLRPAQVEALRTPGQSSAEVTVPAPMDGVLTARAVNPGQVLSMGQDIGVITDLTQVWVVGDVYEQDVPHVRLGTDAALTTPAYARRTWRGQVTYVDPRVDPQTRTAKVRVDLANAEKQLRPGMYMTMALTTRDAGRQVVVPRAALQSLGSKTVVFVAVPEAAGTFQQRVVQTEPLDETLALVRQGLQPGEQVVTTGSFFLRAESLRQAPASS